MERVVEDFILYLHETKNTSKNTEVSYERDLKKLIRYLQERHRRFPEILRRSGLCIII